MTKISLETEYGIASIEVRENCISIDQMFNSLIEPVLVASGYSQKQVDDYFERSIADSVEHITIESP